MITRASEENAPLEPGKEERCSLGLHYRADRASPRPSAGVTLDFFSSNFYRVRSFVSRGFMMGSSEHINFVAVYAGE